MFALGGEPLKLPLDTLLREGPDAVRDARCVCVCVCACVFFCVCLCVCTRGHNQKGMMMIPKCHDGQPVATTTTTTAAAQPSPAPHWTTLTPALSICFDPPPFPLSYTLSGRLPRPRLLGRASGVLGPSDPCVAFASASLAMPLDASVLPMPPGLACLSAMVRRKGTARQTRQDKAQDTANRPPSLASCGRGGSFRWLRLLSRA